MGLLGCWRAWRARRMLLEQQKWVPLPPPKLSDGDGQKALQIVSLNADPDEISRLLMAHVEAICEREVAELTAWLRENCAHGYHMERKDGASYIVFGDIAEAVHFKLRWL